MPFNPRLKRKGLTMMKASLLTLAAAAILFATAAPIALAQDAAKATPVDKGLVAAYDFRGGDTAAVKDLTGRGHDAKTSAGAPTIEDGAAGKVLVLDGKSCLVVAAHKDFDIDKALTIDAWVQADEINKEGYQNFIARERASFRLQCTPKNMAYFGMKGPGPEQKRVDLQTKTTLQAKKWYRVTGVYKKPTLTLYIDGKKVAKRNTVPEFESFNKGKVVIGAYSVKGKQGLKGKIAQIRIYNIARPPQAGDEKPLAVKAE
jgi:Concanavalin A-like lectin/glucanases superfamily